MRSECEGAQSFGRERRATHGPRLCHDTSFCSSQDRCQVSHGRHSVDIRESSPAKRIHPTTSAPQPDNTSILPNTRLGQPILLTSLTVLVTPPQGSLDNKAEPHPSTCKTFGNAVELQAYIAVFHQRNRRSVRSRV